MTAQEKLNKIVTLRKTGNFQEYEAVEYKEVKLKQCFYCHKKSAVDGMILLKDFGPEQYSCGECRAYQIAAMGK